MIIKNSIIPRSFKELVVPFADTCPGANLSEVWPLWGAGWCYTCNKKAIGCFLNIKQKEPTPG